MRLWQRKDLRIETPEDAKRGAESPGPGERRRLFVSAAVVLGLGSASKTYGQASNAQPRPSTGGADTPFSALAAAFQGNSVLPGAQLSLAGTRGALTLQHDHQAANAAGYVSGLKVGVCAGTENSWTLNPASGNWVALYTYINSTGRREIWASNPITDVFSGQDATAWGEEININNMASEVVDPEAPLKKVSLDLVSGGTRKLTAHLRFSAGGSDGAAGKNWPYFGAYFTRCATAGAWFTKVAGDSAAAFRTAAIRDNSDSAITLKIDGGSHAYGIDMNGATFSANAIRIPNNKAIETRSAADDANLSLIYANAGNYVVVNGNSSRGCVMGHDTFPIGDNRYSCGTTGARWSSFWASNGAIQTSDARLKKDIAELPSTLGLVQTLSPRTYKWIEGGVELEYAFEERLVQDARIEEVREPYVEIVDGKPVRRFRSEKKETPLYDQIPVVDETGRIVMVDTRDQAGNVTGAVPMLHPVPRMVKKLVRVEKTVSKSGNRTHWGFLARDVKAAFDQLGMDFGGYVKAEDGTEHLRPDQLIAVLWKGLQEEHAIVQQLSAKVAALEAGRSGPTQP